MTRLALLAAAFALSATSALAAPADLVITDAKITTADPAHPTAEALAVTGGKLVYVGDAAGACCPGWWTPTSIPSASSISTSAT